MLDFWLTMADSEFYVPLERADDPGERYTPARVPAGWSARADGVWTHWSPSDPVVVEQGWKIHVSTTQERLQFTLDTVASVCHAEGTAFKHLSAPLFFAAFHHKHSSRAQAGKFCALYPPDARTARLLMDRLSDRLTDEVGPYVLSDRRYGDRGVVHYRYGAYLARSRIQLDGTSRQLVRDGDGNDATDVRAARFVLPPGIEDPFSPSASAHTGPITLGDRFTVTGVIRHSNGGGTYRATDARTGGTVFVKEARAHNGLIGDGTDSRDRLRAEYATLTHVHAQAPGLCPEPIAYLTQWEHDFLVTEFVEGTGFLQWVAAETVMGRIGVEPRRHSEYLGKVRRVLAALRTDIDRLHALGLRFGDLSHGNVLVLGDLTVRLIDFETSNPLVDRPSLLGTPGYKPPRALADAGVEEDEYGFSGMALCALFPFSQPLERDPHGRADLFRRDLEQEVAVPQELWRTATRYYGRGAPEIDCPYGLPTAAELDEDPGNALTRLREGIAAGLLAMARPDGKDWVFPPPPAGYSVNTHCVEHGTAGVLHALHQSGVEIPEDILRRFRRDALGVGAGLAPGLQNGTAGIAWVLAEMGLLAEARAVLHTSLQHPLALASAQLAHGASGIGMAHIALHTGLGDDTLLRTAVKLGDTFIGDNRDRVLSGAGMPGLAAGLSGTALFLHTLGEYTGERRYTKGAVSLMHTELDKAADGGADGLLFHDDTGTRVVPYLSAGSAGVATVLSRLAAATGDERCVRALPRVLTMCRLTCAAEPGLYAGVGSWAFTLAEHADHAGGPADLRTAVRIATGLAKYTIRHPSGFRVLGAGQERFKADLGTGGAGVLLALARVLDGPRVRLFTLDGLSAVSPPHPPHRSADAVV